MRIIWSCLAVLIIYGLFAASDALASETIIVNGLDNCKKNFYTEIGGIESKPGYVFLVTGFGIEYTGSKTVSIDPSYFALKLDNVQYPNSGATYYLGQKGQTPLPSVTLYGGGRIERGYIAYEIPEDNRDRNCQIVYSGWEDVNIQYQCI
jgi:hypothetical protein